MKMIEERAEAGDFEGSDEPAPKPARTEGKVIDLMSLLKASVDKGGARGDSGKAAAAKKAPAKKAAKKKAPAKKAPAKRTAAKGRQKKSA
jgi:non-homologous end joining protein Ku